MNSYFARLARRTGFGHGAARSAPAAGPDLQENLAETVAPDSSPVPVAGAAQTATAAPQRDSQRMSTTTGGIPATVLASAADTTGPRIVTPATVIAPTIAAGDAPASAHADRTMHSTWARTGSRPPITDGSYALEPAAYRDAQPAPDVTRTGPVTLDRRALPDAVAREPAEGPAAPGAIARPLSTVDMPTAVTVDGARAAPRVRTEPAPARRPISPIASVKPETELAPIGAGTPQPRNDDPAPVEPRVDVHIGAVRLEIHAPPASKAPVVTAARAPVNEAPRFAARRHYLRG